MVMVKMPAARRHHRFRIGYALGLFAFLAIALALTARHPAFSATDPLADPVPAPAITVAGEDAHSATSPSADFRSLTDPADEPAQAGAGEDEPAPAGGADVPADADQAGAGAGEGTLADRPLTSTDPGRSLFYSGLLGLAISLAGLGLVGTRRRQW
ncbi:hypothetical protein O7602_28855 [Micromonospora sp. WMMD1128]|uniref:hypothetical protein n=1 Tax=unclassified Micromonospora TaxID=2617518 RepID=UPI00248C09A9|nr:MULTISPECIES: hypothetical protein [unclassified Micromonospora]WBB73625.1 hypothetical protein O7602_28855 [Micromonospora sp. WMMD1128]WFE36833.1 hypothetical protein O7613_26115 [Micromonospora sp. WMMD975]